MFYVYILLCNDNTYYIGSTNDLKKRIHAHNHLKNGAHYTKIRRPVHLVYHDVCDTYADARAKEAALKGLTRTQKKKLIDRASFE